MNRKLSQEQLVGLVNNICNPRLSDREVSEYIEILARNVPHPALSDLIFSNEKDLSPEEVVEAALAYKEK
ncbi:bacteriocin immunity protein [Priestia endophytica]|uniref:bacteriocin immunity protein n=1 Tax=Priestia endophytica TaxID=135735 RepID=UPI00203A4403|nr:bacteriocin immunity protein [Priestia endophytica]MCM3537767.1 bacteriocin immunity protein [Priestia endophytica]